MLSPDIRVVDEHVYAVEVVREDDRALSEHTVRVPTELIEAWGLGLTQEPPLVRAAMTLLIQRHGAALPADFVLTDAGVAYEGFLDELRLAVTS